MYTLQLSVNLLWGIYSYAFWTSPPLIAPPEHSRPLKSTAPIRGAVAPTLRITDIYYPLNKADSRISHAFDYYNPLQAVQSRQALLIITARKRFFSKALFSVASVIFYFFYFFVCYHDNSWKAQPIRAKFSQKTFNWNSSAMYENGPRWSHVTLPNRGASATPPPEILHTSNFNQTKPSFTHDFWLE